MRVTSISISNFRAYAYAAIDLDQINVLVGANNAGKSSILRALCLMQNGLVTAPAAEVRAGETHWEVLLKLENIRRKDWPATQSAELYIKYGERPRLTTAVSGTQGVEQVPGTDPNHFIVPYLSKRKVTTYIEDVRQQYALAVTPSMDNLAAKLSRIASPSFPEFERYRATCEAILGFVVVATPSAGGMRPGMYLPDRTVIPIDQMGEGVPNIVSLLADLAISEGKLFLLEEPENDLHPEALKALLDLVIQSASSNQFVVSTHSNIVVRHLCSAKHSLLYNVTSAPNTFPTISRIDKVLPTPAARLEVLRQLGYTFSDFELWDGWLILEEASAERIIRDYLIPWFAPKLSRVRTLSTNGNSQVENTFEDFNRLVRFTHLEEAYRDSAWIRVDGDEQGKEIVARLQERYKGWKPDHFGVYTSAQFETYYPKEFSGQAVTALAITDKQAKREAKKALLDDVRAWLDADEARGRAALEKSAAEIIADLQAIEAELLAK